MRPTDPKTRFQLPAADDLTAMVRLANAVHAAETGRRVVVLLEGLLTLLPAGGATWSDGRVNVARFRTNALRAAAKVDDRPATLRDGEAIEQRPDGRAIYAAGGGAVTAVYRNADAPAFGERDRLVLRLLRDQCGPSLLSEPPAAPASVPKRVAGVLELLLQGHDELTIARRLNRPAADVKAQCDRHYRAFDVTTRHDLLARFRRRPAEGQTASNDEANVS